MRGGGFEASSVRFREIDACIMDVCFWPREPPSTSGGETLRTPDATCAAMEDAAEIAADFTVGVAVGARLVDQEVARPRYHSYLGLILSKDRRTR